MGVSLHGEFMDLLHGAKEEGNFCLQLFSLQAGILDEGLTPHAPFASWQKWPLQLAHPLVLRPPAPRAILHRYLCLLG